MANQAFAQRLKLARQERGMTQRLLSQRSGVPQSTICHYEMGDMEPGIENLIAMLKILDCTADWLLGLKEAA
ncbi:helix-turn-helix transcriptional regulator [Cupriavidus sp. DL-D2]|uniref:helix-turn-helix domain-containing protein n=1 Tax=Cupriavidus sp. DL-D2 TaxID=3144974 RepID=UPI0032139F7C